MRAPARTWPGDSPFWWLHLNGKSGFFAGLTGSDHKALLAIAAAWDMYGYCDRQRDVIRAVAHLLGGLQEKYWPLARELIAKSLDWGDRDRLWPLVLTARAEFEERQPQRVLEEVPPNSGAR